MVSYYRAGSGSKPDPPSLRTGASIAARVPVGADSDSPASRPQASVSPTVVVGPELAISQWTAGSPAAASGSIQPAWLSPNRPTRVRSICGSAATNATSAFASRARSWTVPAAAASPGYVPPD